MNEQEFSYQIEMQINNKTVLYLPDIDDDGESGDDEEPMATEDRELFLLGVGDGFFFVEEVDKVDVGPVRAGEDAEIEKTIN